MLINLIDTEIPFREYKLTTNELSKCRKRLLAIEPDLCIAEEEGQSEDEDWEDVFYFIGDEHKIICIIPCCGGIDIPEIFVLSNEQDYKMNCKSVFEFLTNIYEKKPGLRLSNMQFTSEDENPPYNWLVHGVASYLTEASEETEICNSYDNYHSGVVVSEPKKIDVNEATRLIQVVLTTVYNYSGQYKLTSKDIEDLLLYGDVEAGSKHYENSF